MGAIDPRVEGGGEVLGVGESEGAIGPSEFDPLGVGLGVGAIGPRVEGGGEVVSVGVPGAIGPSEFDPLGVVVGGIGPGSLVRTAPTLVVPVGVATIGGSSPPYGIDGADPGVTCCRPGAVAPGSLHPLTINAAHSVAPATAALTANIEPTLTDVIQLALNCLTSAECMRMPELASSPRSWSWHRR